MGEVRDRWRSFYDRRVRIPVGEDALVLDVGSGDKPFWRADVLLDRYASDEFAGQRSGTGHTRVDRPLFDAPAEEMPFRDKVFDYVICSHVLEHVLDPVAVVAEMVRVAKAGYIEVPEASASKIIDFPSHLWWCRLDSTSADPVLVFTAKTSAGFDEEIDAYLRRTGLAPKVKRLIDTQHHHNIISLRWRGTQQARSQGHLDPDFARRTINAEAHHRAGAASLSSALVRGLTIGRGRRAAPIRFNDLVLPRFRRDDDPVLSPGIYQLDY